MNCIMPYQDKTKISFFCLGYILNIINRSAGYKYIDRYIITDMRLTWRIMLQGMTYDHGHLVVR